MTTTPMASVSLDVDDQWTYMKTRGLAGWQDRPSYLGMFAPVALEFFASLGVTTTFFVVGADAARQENGPALRSLVERGHELGNHSYEHEPWLHTYDVATLEREVGRTHDAIANATGVQPIGFRGPGFTWSPDLLRLLAARGYVFDASTFPTWIGPLARWYYFRGAPLSASERAQRATLFGALAEGRRPNVPYKWMLGGTQTLLEIPVTTVPGIRTPLHLSYLLYLSRYSERLMSTYLRAAIRLCLATGTEPSFLLHPLDLLGAEDAPALRFFPGMDLPRRRKLALATTALGMLADHFAVVPMGAHARAILARGTVRHVAEPGVSMGNLIPVEG